jgi:dihydroorotase
MIASHHIVLKSVRIIDKSSPHHLQTQDVRLLNGIIEEIGSIDAKGDGIKVIEGKSLILTQGWFDLRANFNDPGHEHKEDLTTGSLAAMMGGFTEVALLPNTHPVIQTKNDIHYIRKNSQLVNLHAIAAVTKDLKGEDLTEMIDLHEAGTVAFSDGEKTLYHSDILLKTLQYLQKFNGLLINRPEDKWLALFGQMHEGIISTQLGMRGIPALAEELMMMRDLRLLEFGGGKIHFSTISTAEGVDLVRKAKAKGLKVTCDVAAHQLYFTDEALQDFDTNYKVSPPLRDEHHRKALIAGLKDGTIDAIVSAHSPQDEESKKLEFDLAESGIIALQTVLPILESLSKELGWETLVEKITSAPRNILAQPFTNIAKGQKANLTLFAPEESWVLDGKSNASKSVNSPFWGQTLKGKVKLVANNGLVNFNNH